MKFYEVVEHVLTLLRREGRVSYRALKREFALDDAYLEDLTERLQTGRRRKAAADGVIL